MNVLEIFYSIQGEGKYVGTPVIFIRTAGCSLKCPWCDTKPSWTFPYDDGVDYKHILQDVQRANPNCKTVVITGGEPTEQRDLYKVAEELKFAGYDVHLETNGSSDIMSGYFTYVACSPKPGTHYRVPKGATDLKYVISASMDPDFINNEMIPGFIRDKYRGRIWLQPMDEADHTRAENLAFCYRLATTDPRLKVGLQLHKIMGVK